MKRIRNFGGREKDFPGGISVIKSEEHQRASSIERETFMTRNGASKKDFSDIKKMFIAETSKKGL